MNYRSYLFGVILNLIRICSYSQNSHGPLEVKYVSFSIETPFSIYPTIFDSAFVGEYKFLDIDNRDSICDLVYTYLSGFKKVKSQSVDSRVEVLYSIQNVEIIKWMNKFGIFTDGKYCYKNENLFNFLKKSLNQ